jgi:hypothetical protein
MIVVFGRAVPAIASGLHLNERGGRDYAGLFLVNG